MLQGVTSFHDEHTPTCALPQSSSVMPMARSIARAGARSAPSVTSRLRILTSTVDSLAGLADRGSDMGNQRTPGRTGASHPFRPFRPGLTGGSVPPASTTSRLHSPFDREIVRLAIPALGALVAEPIYVLTDTAIVGHLGTAAARRPGGGHDAAADALRGVHLPRLRDDRGGGPPARRGRPARGGPPGGAVAVARRGGRGGAGRAGPGRRRPRSSRCWAARGRCARTRSLYLRVSLLGMPALLVMLAGTGYLRGLQDTRTPLVVAVGTAPLNLVLEVVLIYGLGLRHRGVGAVHGRRPVRRRRGLRAAHRAGRAGARRRPARPTRPAVRRLGRVGADLLVRTAALRALARWWPPPSPPGIGPVDARRPPDRLRDLEPPRPGPRRHRHRRAGDRSAAASAPTTPTAARAAGRRMIEWGVAGGVVAGGRPGRCCRRAARRVHRRRRGRSRSPRSCCSGWPSCSRSTAVVRARRHPHRRRRHALPGLGDGRRASAVFVPPAVAVAVLDARASAGCGRRSALLMAARAVDARRPLRGRPLGRAWAPCADRRAVRQRSEVGAAVGRALGAEQRVGAGHRARRVLVDQAGPPQRRPASRRRGAASPRSATARVEVGIVGRSARTRRRRGRRRGGTRPPTSGRSSSTTSITSPSSTA